MNGDARGAAAWHDDPWRFSRRLGRLREFVDANLHRRITIAEAASIVGLEEHYFCNWFRKLTGESFGAWLAKERLAHAEDLFTRYNYIVSEVTYLAGFGSYDAFYRACRQYREMPPRQLMIAAHRSPKKHDDPK